MAELPPGSVVAGCRIEGVIGRGGMGLVYRATQLSLERPVALKAIAPELASDESFRERFKRESRIAASIEHPNVIPVYEAGEGDGLLYLIMRYVEGTDLRALIDAHGPLPPPRAAALVAQVAAALAAAHRRGLVHRDVKPANVLIDSDGERDHAYLTDFGIARHVAATSGLTRTGAVVGTLDYLAPERMMGDGGGDESADVYALGCVLFETLTATVPYPRDNEVAKMYAHLNAPVPRVREVVPEVPGELEALAARAMAKEPAERFASAAEMAAALAGATAVSPRPAADAALPEAAAWAVPAGRSEEADLRAKTGEESSAAARRAEPAGPEEAVEESSAAARGVEPGLEEAGEESSAAARRAEPAGPVGAEESSAAERRAEPAGLGKAGEELPPAARTAEPKEAGEELPAAATEEGGDATASETGEEPPAVATEEGEDATASETGEEPPAVERTAGDEQAGAAAATEARGEPTAAGTVGDGATGETLPDGTEATTVGTVAGRSEATAAQTSGRRRLTAAQTNGRRRLAAALAALAGGAAVVVLLVALAGGEEDPTAERRPAAPRPAAVEAPAAVAVAGRFRLDRGADGVAAGAGAVWVANKERDVVVRLDPADGGVEAQIRVGAEPDSLAVADEGVWVTSTSDDSVSLIDPETNSVAVEVGVGRGPEGIAVGHGAVWVANMEGGTVTRFEPADPEGSRSTSPVGKEPVQLAVAPGGVWVTLSGEDAIVRLDPDTGERAGSPIEVPRAPRGIAYERSTRSLWVAASRRDRLAIIDLPTTTIQFVSTPNDPREVRTGLGAVWVTSALAGRLTAYDPRSREPIDGVPVPPKNYGLAVGEGFAWSASLTTGALRKVEAR